MLKLLKYDLRRRRERILVFIVIALIFQAGMWISSSKMDLKLVSLNLIGYAGLAISLIFICVFSYFRNLKSYQRRLLPVTALQSVLSPLLFAMLLLLTVIALGFVHMGIYYLLYPMDFLPGNILTVGVKGLVQSIWSSIFLMILCMFSITVALSLRFKWRVWIGIVLFTLLQNGIAYLEMYLFDSYYIGLDNAFNLEINTNNLPSDSGITISSISMNPWQALFELIIACILIYSMVVLVKKRMEL